MQTDLTNTGKQKHNNIKNSKNLSDKIVLEFAVAGKCFPQDQGLEF